MRHNVQTCHSDCHHNYQKAFFEFAIIWNTIIFASCLMSVKIRFSKKKQYGPEIFEKMTILSVSLTI